MCARGYGVGNGLQIDLGFTATCDAIQQRRFESGVLRELRYRELLLGVKHRLWVALAWAELGVFNATGYCQPLIYECFYDAATKTLGFECAAGGFVALQALYESRLLWASEDSLWCKVSLWGQFDGIMRCVGLHTLA